VFAPAQPSMALAIPGIVEKGGVIPMSAANAGTSAAGSPLLVEIVKVADRLRRTESLAVDTTLADVDNSSAWVETLIR
jgi:hypothetical protein